MIREFYKFKLFEKQNKLAWIVLSSIILIRFITDFHRVYRLIYSNYCITNALTNLKISCGINKTWRKYIYWKNSIENFSNELCPFPNRDNRQISHELIYYFDRMCNRPSLGEIKLTVIFLQMKDHSFFSKEKMFYCVVLIIEPTCNHSFARAFCC